MDNILIIQECNNEKLQRLLEKFNSLEEKIKFKFEIGNKK